uniref:Protein arginine N-methyltransferase 6 n=1 Tax=Oncorhynchus mykiss TaxID=8022 RepID=A0A8C7VPR9_ONCMY
MLENSATWQLPTLLFILVKWDTAPAHPPLELAKDLWKELRKVTGDSLKEENSAINLCSKRKLDRNVQDNLYFDSYSDITIHEEMIADTVQTNTYRTGVLRNGSSFQRKVVLDVGEGTGASLPKPGPGKFTSRRAVQSLELYIAPINDLVVEGRLSFWSTMKDMSCMSEFARKCIMNNDITVNLVMVADVFSHPSKFARVVSVLVYHGAAEISEGGIQVRVFWFVLTFPGSEEKPLVLSTSPFKTGYPLEDTTVVGEGNMSPSEDTSRHITIHLPEYGSQSETTIDSCA